MTTANGEIAKRVKARHQQKVNVSLKRKKLVNQASSRILLLLIVSERNAPMAYQIYLSLLL